MVFFKAATDTRYGGRGAPTIVFALRGWTLEKLYYLAQTLMLSKMDAQPGEQSHDPCHTWYKKKKSRVKNDIQTKLG